MAQSRFYSATAQPTVLTASITPTDVIVQVQQTVGFPANTPYIIALDYGSPSEEVVLVTAAAGTNLTVTRGYDGTSATNHGAGAAVRHTWTAADGNDSRAHEGSTAGVHGVVGNVVGTTDTQTLTNKTLTNATLNTPNINNPSFSGTVNLASPNITGTVTGSASYNTVTLTEATVVNANVANTPLTVNAIAGNNAAIAAVRQNGVDRLSVSSTGRSTISPVAPQNKGAYVNAGTGFVGNLYEGAINSGTAVFNVTEAGNLVYRGTLTGGSSGQFTVSAAGATVAPNFRATAMTSGSTENTTTFNTSSTSYSAMAGTTTAVVPPSGKVKVTATCRMFANQNAGEMWASVTVSGSVSGAIRATNDGTAIYYSQPNAANNSWATCCQSFVVTSANIGETLTVGISGRAGTQPGVTVSSTYRSLVAEPMIG